MGTLTGQGLATFAISKLGTPYVYGAKGADGKFTLNRLNFLARSYPSTFTAAYIRKANLYIGKICTDCSGLISWYTGRVLGSAQMYSTASKRIPISQINTVPIGAVLWKPGHVGVYVGNGEVVEAKGINYGTVRTKVSSTKWQYALLFSYINYTMVTNGVASQPQQKPSVSDGKNPYKKPTSTVRKGASGESVKWVQWELDRAGYNLAPYGGIDGKFGSGTENLVKQFQTSHGLTVDGLVGTKTINALSTDVAKAKNPYKKPTSTVRKGASGESVKWVQWELVEAGYNLTPYGGVDGKFGSGTENFVKQFQKSAKLTADGLVGTKTINALVLN